ncbi:hypothetical protein [Burkholderia sp. BE17]|uniref:hypothetical protein n=1 Tax=Burkholderia sp. BE17 TaxID=2656644 RepID=UPI00128BCA8B|nr:hypothetical protein [Burkholderia sp. BE17]MPV64869.1 hypothetical protein [Burkholderia sp. BE17]
MSKFITRWLWIEGYLLNGKSQEGISRMPMRTAAAYDALRVGRNRAESKLAEGFACHQITPALPVRIRVFALIRDDGLAAESRLQDWATRCSTVRETFAIGRPCFCACANRLGLHRIV